MAEIKISMAAARVNAGLTQTDVSMSLNVNRATVVSWERGYSVPSADKFQRFCELCKIPMDNVLLPKEST